MEETRYLRPKSAANYLGVCVLTLHNYHKKGLLVPARVLADGTRMYTREQLQKFLSDQSTGIPPRVDGLCTIREASILLGRPLSTLRRWDNNGIFPADRYGVNNMRLYREERILAFKRHLDETGYHQTKKKAR